MDTKIKLSIGIPTYNNATGLRAELDCIISQIKKNPELEKDVEILVSDNSDNDETKLIIENYFSNISNLTYIKNIKNIGYDRNVDQILTKSKGIFCWTLSDNDLILDGGIEKIINIIENNTDIAHILINKDKEGGEVKIFENMEELMKENDYKIIGGLVSQNIFNRKYFPEDRNKYYDNLWFHLSILFEICAKKKLILIPNLLEKKSDDVCRWAKNGTTFITYTNLHSIIMNLKNFDYSKNFLNIYHSNFIKGLPRQTITGKLYGLKLNKKSLYTLYNHSKSDMLTFLICFFILITPVFILNTVKNIWKKL